MADKAIGENSPAVAVRYSFPNLSRAKGGPLGWEFVALGLVFGLIAILAFQFAEFAQPIGPQGLPPIDLDYSHLPYYALRTAARMLAAMGLSLLFSLAYATLAARNARAEAILIPILDILQSVPILGYVAVVFTALAAAFPTRTAGYELAAIFALFTSQAWNMTFSFYQSLKTVPNDLIEATRAFQFSGWQKFWRLELPFAMPGLIWNMMMSMSGGWFFVVAAEAVVVGGQSVALPGIGSYIATAIAAERIDAVVASVAAMLAVILIYDQVMMRPLVSWSMRFKLEVEPGERPSSSWVLSALRRSRAVAWMAEKASPVVTASITPPPPLRTGRGDRGWDRTSATSRLVGDGLWYGGWLAIGALGLASVYAYVLKPLGMGEVLHALKLAGYTFLRVMILTAVAAVFWTPIAVWIGMRPNIAKAVQPLAQFLAAFPANLLFPIAVIGIVRFHLDPNIWLSPLIVLGTQWYILFNVVAGASAIPGDMRLAARGFRLEGLLWWRTLALPGVLPYLLTGFVTAAGGAWNASVVAEAVSWGSTNVEADGLGAYIANATEAGDFARIALGVIIMAGIVTGMNRALWRPLYDLAERRYKLG